MPIGRGIGNITMSMPKRRHSEIETALAFYGLAEVEGSASNPILLELIQKYLSWVTDDSEIAWCAIFTTHIAKLTGCPIPKEDPYAARSWLSAGEPVQMEDVAVGDRVIFWRGSKTGWQGHIGYYVNVQDSDRIRVLGGNQGNGVTIAGYRKDRILGVRRTAP